MENKGEVSPGSWRPRRWGHGAPEGLTDADWKKTTAAEKWTVP
jgi:hypothetical protein